MSGPNKEKPVVLIMAGGKGERFWPRSRISQPKQLQKVYSNKTLLRETIDRAVKITDLNRVFIGTNASLKKSILKMEKSFPEKNFIIEPEGKNTAPIIALASLVFKEKFGDPVQVVLSADAFINPINGFVKTIEKAIPETEKSLVLLGVKPDRPETGYGYIQTGKLISQAYQVKQFVEKPDEKTAFKYIKKDNFFWNPGIFLWKTSMILEEFKSYSPSILRALEDRYPFKKFGDLETAFREIQSEAIDTAIMEKSTRIKMVPAEFSWDDVGSWLSLERISPKDNQGNCHLGKGIFYYDSKNNITNTRKELTVILGSSDLIVVEEEDILFISNNKSIGKIKDMLKELGKNRNLQKYLE